MKNNIKLPTSIQVYYFKGSRPKKGGWMRKTKRRVFREDDPISNDGQSERHIVLEALRKNGWNITKAAKSVRMTQLQFIRILRRYGFRDVL